MQISCDCLNIIIKSKKDTFEEFESSVTESFTNDSYFKEDICLLSMVSINVQVPSLVKERESGQWRIFSCFNCNKACYGISSTLGFSSILVRRDLEVDTHKIDRLKQSDLYSPIFKIIIYQSEFSSIDDAVKGDQRITLSPAATAWLNEQTAKAEERVKVYSEKEYAALDELRERAYADQRLINRREQECAKKFQVKVPIEDLNQQLQKSSLETKRKNYVTKSSTDKRSIDSEGVFLLDGIEGGDSSQSPHEESDSDASEDAATVYQSRKTGAAQLAKSLPIPVPVFMEEKQNEPTGASPVPADIAASIKALAKSVHGDNVFGELPPPRFSTNL